MAEPVERSDLPEGQQSKELAEKHPNRMERSELVDEVLRLRWGRDKLTATIAAFPDAHNAANLAHARAERDALRAELARVRTQVAEEIARACDERHEEARQTYRREHDLGRADDGRVAAARSRAWRLAAAVAREHAGAPAESVVAALPSPAGQYDWAVRLTSSRGGEWVLPRDDEAHARQFVEEGPDAVGHPDAVVVRRWVGDWEVVPALPDVVGTPDLKEG